MAQAIKILMIKYNILITSAGRRVSLVRLFQQAIKDLKINGLVYAVDMQAHAPALQVADKFKIIKKVNDPHYIKQLLDICIKNDINLIIPTIDTELYILSQNVSYFEDKGIKLLVCNETINQICEDKRNTQKFFNKNNIPTPAFYTLNEAKNLNTDKFPIILKPAQGNSSIGVTLVNNLKELIFFYEYIDDAIIQDYIEGNEFTIDVLIDFNSKVRCAVPRLRIETRAGEVSKAVTVNDPVIIDWSYKIAKALKDVVGCITIQCIKNNNGELKFIEINPRFGGGFPLSDRAGASFPRWILQMLLNIELETNLQNQWKSGQTMLRYDEGLFTTRDKVKL